jgi:acyl-coenzyme A thioesterase PaaI-like protein
MELIDEGMCFVCGKANPKGLRVEFAVDRKARRITGVFTPEREHEGYKGIMHGGLVGALLDEAMVKLLWESGTPAVSASLEIRLARPAMVGEPLEISGWVEEDRGKVLVTAARIVDLRGNLLAEARGKCIRVQAKEERSAS